MQHIKLGRRNNKLGATTKIYMPKGQGPTHKIANFKFELKTCNVGYMPPVSSCNTMFKTCQGVTVG